MKCPQLVTYAADEHTLRAALTAGAEHIILEDSKLAVRSYSDDFSQFGFQKIIDLANVARELNSDIQLSVNIDKLLHHRHYVLCDALLQACKQNTLLCFRVQDPGLVAYICEQIPEATMHIASETSYANVHGIQALVKSRPAIQRMVLSNDWSRELIHSVCSQLDCQLEYQVHGPVLLQYTDRRLLTGYEVKQGNCSESADDAPALGERRVRVEDRDYHFYDNQHGNFMYASFDKSLFKNIDTLMELELDAWLLDARGECEDYLSVMLTTYAAARNTYLKSSDSYELSVASVGALQEVARRPLKPGFFIANNTDYVFESQAQDHQQRNYVGKIIDSIKTKTFCIEAFEDISPGMYAVHTPEGKEKKGNSLIKTSHVVTFSSNSNNF